jgi:hypothetical protein
MTEEKAPVPINLAMNYIRSRGFMVELQEIKVDGTNCINTDLRTLIISQIYKGNYLYSTWTLSLHDALHMPYDLLIEQCNERLNAFPGRSGKTNG